jgi:hypothetical protein
VTDVPGIGDIGEGDVSDEMKEKALEGRINYVVTKNSWGKDRPERGLTDGYTRFDLAYLNTPIMQEHSPYYAQIPLYDFVLPAGY